MQGVGIAMQMMHKSYKCMEDQQNLSGMCIQVACSWRPRTFEEARHRNIQAKFYNKKFPLAYENDNSGDSIYEEHAAPSKQKCGKI